MGFLVGDGWDDLGGVETAEGASEPDEVAVSSAHLPAEPKCFDLELEVAAGVDA